MPISRCFVAVVFAVSALAPLSRAVAQVPILQLTNPSLTFDATLEPLGQFGIESTESLAITRDYNLARQEVALAIAYLTVNRQVIEAGQDKTYNRIFGNFYNRADPNFGNGYAVDESNYFRVLDTFGSIRGLLEQPTSFADGLNNSAGTAALDATQPDFLNLNRGMRQWGMSNSDSTAVYDAYYPLYQNGLPGNIGTQYPTGGGGATRTAPGQGPLVPWDQDTARSTPAIAGQLFNIPGVFPNPTIPDKNNPQLVYTPPTAAVVGAVVQTGTSGTLQAYEDPLRTYSHSVDQAFYNQKLDIFGAAGKPNQVTLGQVFLQNTPANRAAGVGIERIGNLPAGLSTVNPNGFQTLPWNSGNASATRDPADFKVPDLNRFEMIISSFAEFTSNPLDPRGGAFFGIDALVNAFDPTGPTKLQAGVLDAGNYGLFVEALNQGGVTDARNFPPVGKNGSFFVNQFVPGVPNL